MFSEFRDGKFSVGALLAYSVFFLLPVFLLFALLKPLANAKYRDIALSPYPEYHTPSD
jgi:hypothetical protein